MGNCTEIKFIDGGTIKDATINNPTISNGTATGLNLIAPSITGGITLDAATAQLLVNQLCPYIEDCLSGGQKVDRITGIRWEDTQKTRLLVDVAYEDDTTFSWSVDFSTFLKFTGTSATAPSKQVGDRLPLVTIGDVNVSMCGPLAWWGIAPGLGVPLYSLPTAP